MSHLCLYYSVCCVRRSLCRLAYSVASVNVKGQQLPSSWPDVEMKCISFGEL